MSNIIDFPLRGLAPIGQAAVTVPSHRYAGTLLRRWRDRATFRSMLRQHLLTQPDSVLADAGWTRDAAEKEAGKPIWRA